MVASRHQLISRNLLPRDDGKLEPLENTPKFPLIPEFPAELHRISNDVPTEFPTHLLNSLGVLIDEEMDLIPETVDMLANAMIFQKERGVNRILWQCLFLRMLPLETEGVTILCDILEILRILIRNDPIVLEEKSGYEAHERGNSHSEKKVPPFIDYSYELAEMILHGIKNWMCMD
jgi:hypothetical protein